MTRLSVAVLVNVPAAARAANAASPAYAVSPADVAKIRNAIAAAAGIDASRGDQVSVEAIPFAPPAVVAGGCLGSGTTVSGFPAVPASCCSSSSE